MLQYGFHHQTFPYREVDQSSTCHQPSWSKNDTPASNYNNSAPSTSGINDEAFAVTNSEAVIDSSGDKQIKVVENNNRENSYHSANVGMKEDETKLALLSKPKIKPTFLSKMISSRIIVPETKKPEQKLPLKPSFSKAKLNTSQKEIHNPVVINKRSATSLVDSDETTESKSMKISKPVSMTKPSFNLKKLSGPNFNISSRPTFSKNPSIPSSSNNNNFIQTTTNLMTVPTMICMKQSVAELSVQDEFKKPSNSNSKQPPASQSAVKKKPTIANVNIEELIQSRRLSEVNKLNVATLLDYCRNSGIKQAKAKSKKDELLRLIFMKHNVISANEQ